MLPYDLRDAAKLICCHQDIGADSCFALGMIARFEAAWHEPWLYRCLFWECGMIGHVLYLEAEAAGVRSTGSAAFSMTKCTRSWDDHSWQSLYHFTLGGAVDDTRLSSLPLYEFQP